MAGSKYTIIEDDTTRNYLDEIGRVPLIDHRKELEHGLAIERSNHITKLRETQPARKPHDTGVTDRMLHYINASAPTISGIFRHAGLDPNPHMREISKSPAFRQLIDGPLDQDIKHTAAKWSGITDDKHVAAHLRRVSLDTASLTHAIIHLTDNCRLSQLTEQLNDPDHQVRRNVMSRHLTRQLDELVSAGERHEQELASANLRLVVSVAREYASQNIPMMDLVQEGNVGLLVGIRKYNHRVGTRFSTYATWWIRHHVIQCLNKQGRTIRLPEHQIKLIGRISAARRHLSQELGRPPTDAETAEYMNLDLEDIQHTDVIRQLPANLDQPISEDGETLLQHTIASQDLSVAETVEERVLPEVVRQAMSQIPDIEREVLTLRYGLLDDNPLTVTAIGQRLGINNKKVREVEQRAITRMQDSPELRRLLLDFAS